MEGTSTQPHRAEAAYLRQSGVIEPDATKFEIFKKQAYDLTPSLRSNDTELKFIFNLLEQHWDKGNKFIIELESTLKVCQSCRGYLVFLNELAMRQGKIVQIKIIAPPAEGIRGIEDLLK